MSPSPAPDLLFDLVHPQKVLLVLDVVEPQRLMERDEQDYIERWRKFIHAIREQVLPRHEGHVHKSLGDGLMLEFGDAWQGVAAALQIQAINRQDNEALAPDARMQVRAAIHFARF